MSQMDYQSNMPKDSGSDRRLSGEAYQAEGAGVEQAGVSPIRSCLPA